ncbi:MAG: hypothetical protein DRO40_07755 [Thermoprotei archaeon]|nr:MAG: hypothetical protein DRO40_07755 [Thermoprotei archaeon]
MREAVLLFLLFSIALFNPFHVVADNKVVGVYFYPWYSVTLNRHWSENVIDKPYIGYYDSDNPETITWQLKLISEAGIDLVVFSWWGPNSFEDNTTKVIVKYLNGYGLKFAIMVEPYLGQEPSLYNKTFWENVLGYIKNNYIDKYREDYFHLNGKPLVLAFNPIGMNYNPSNDFPDYTIRITGNDIDNAGYQDWDYWPDYIDPNSVELRIRKDGYVSIIPRFDDTHFRAPGTCIDQNYTQGLYEKEWEWILEHKDSINIVMVTSWNEYHERTMVEPHYDNTSNVDPFYIYDLTKRYIQELEEGERITQEYVYGFNNYVLAWVLILFIFGSMAKIILRILR